MNNQILEQKLERERLARIEAEELLESKSKELFLMNKMLRSTADQLSLQTSQLNIILDNTLSGIVLVSDEFHIIRANQYAEKLFGYEKDTLFGSNILSFIDCEPDQIQSLVSNKSCVSVEAKYSEFIATCSHGKTYPIELSISEADIKGNSHTIWIFRNISQRKIQEAERELLEEELRQALKLEALGTLASGIAHEINTPIQFVGDNLHFLNDSFSDLMSQISSAQSEGNQAVDNSADDDLAFMMEEIPQAIAQSLDGITRVSEIVKSVRNFSHPGTKEKILTDMNQSIEGTVTLSTNQWKYVAELETQFEDNLPEVSCIPGEINQVILNLIVNAAQAIETCDSAEKGKIKVQTRLVPDYVEISVSDTGCGISDEHKDHIFDPFFTTKEVGKGTGQGLALAHNIIVKKHSGKLYFETEAGKGTTFFIRLPLKEADVPEKAA